MGTYKKSRGKSAANCFAVLGLGIGASLEEIKKAYRRLARSTHPDRGADGDEERFKEIVDAYEILSDPKKRMEHVRKLQEQDRKFRARTTDAKQKRSRNGGQPSFHLDSDATLVLTKDEAAQGGVFFLRLPTTTPIQVPVFVPPNAKDGLKLSVDLWRYGIPDAALTLTVEVH